MDGKKLLSIGAIGEMVIALALTIYSFASLDTMISIAQTQYGEALNSLNFDLKSAAMVLFLIFFGIRFLFGLIGFLAKGKAKIFIIVLGVLLVLLSIPSFAAGAVMGIVTIVEFVVSLIFVVGAIKIKIEE